MGRTVPLPQVVLFAAIGWLPAVAPAVAVAVSLVSARPAAAPPERPAAGADLFAAFGATPKENDQRGAGTPLSAGTPPGGRTAPLKPRTLLTRSGTGNWTGPPAAATADAPMTVAYPAVCRSGPPFLTVSWDGDGPDYDYLTVSGTLRMSGSGRLDPVSAAGRFEVRTRTDCAWTVRVTQTS